MQGPYSRLLPLRTRDHMLGLPHLSRHFHVLRLAADVSRCTQHSLHSPEPTHPRISCVVKDTSTMLGQHPDPVQMFSDLVSLFLLSQGGERFKVRRCSQNFRIGNICMMSRIFGVFLIYFNYSRFCKQKGVTISVKMGPIIDVGHDIKYFDGFYNLHVLLTFGFDGNVILRQPDAPAQYGKWFL